MGYQAASCVLWARSAAPNCSNFPQLCNPTWAARARTLSNNCRENRLCNRHVFRSEQVACWGFSIHYILILCLYFCFQNKKLKFMVADLKQKFKHKLINRIWNKSKVILILCHVKTIFLLNISYFYCVAISCVNKMYKTKDFLFILITIQQENSESCALFHFALSLMPISNFGVF